MKNNEFIKWEKNRSKTYYIFCFLTLIGGIEWGIVVPTLYHYLTDVIQAKNSKVWNGFIFAGFWVVSIIGSLAITRYSDATRNIRQSLMFICIVAALGNFIYAVPLSPVFPLIGRALQGFSDAMVPVINGEILRVYPEDQVMKKVGRFVSMVYIAIIISPIFVIIFQDFHANFFSLTLGPSNSPNFFLGFLWLFGLALVIIFVSDSSKKYDLKYETTKIRRADLSNGIREDCNGTATEQSPVDVNPEKILPLRILWKDCTFCFIVGLSVLCNYTCIANSSMLLPIVGERLYGLSPSFIAIIQSTSGITFAFSVFIVSRIDSHRTEVYFVIIGLCTYVLSFQFMTLAIIRSNAHTFGIVSLFCYSILIGTSWSVEQVLLTILLGYIIPSSTQSFAEGIRRSMNAIGALLASVVGGLIESYIIEHDYVLTVLLFLSAGYLLRKRKQFCNLQFIEVKKN